jgi:hypothetical protein
MSQIKIKEITPEQASKFKEWAENWINIGLSTEEADFEKATQAALKAYELCNLNKPAVIIRVGSPLAATIAGAYAVLLLKQLFFDKKNITQMKSQVANQVQSHVASNVASQVERRVIDHVLGQVIDHVLGQVKSHVLGQVQSHVLDQVKSHVKSNVERLVADHVASQVIDHVLGQVQGHVLDQVKSHVKSQVERLVADQVALHLVKSHVLGQVQSHVASNVADHVASHVVGHVLGQVQSHLASNVASQVERLVADHVASHVVGQVQSHVASNVASQVERLVADHVASQVIDHVLGQVQGHVLDQVKSQVREKAQEGFNNYRGGSFWAGWCSYISYIRDILGWDDSTLEKFKIEEDLAKSCGWVWWHENVLVISDRPNLISRDEEGRLHNIDGPAISYRDGWSIYSIHGVRLPEWIIKAPEKITVENIEEEENLEIKRVMIDKYGLDKYIENSGAIMIHKDKFGELYKKKFANDEPIVVVKVINSTPEPDNSSKIYFLRVPPNMTNTTEAVAWTFGLDKKSYKPSIET